ncbi:MAG TPA: hypothetical protein VHW91_01250 [Candidatus Dormibacteraeota bacterium]|jgi:hypothetical protein|nr:hypothetical protein [Candidatus Dormibacteraeota bacterium]
MAERLSTFLTSRRHVAGCGLALLGAVLALLDPVGPAGLLLVGGFYLVGVAAGGPNSRVERYWFDPQQLAKALQRQAADVSGRLPADVMVQLQGIELLMRTQVFPRLDSLPPGSLDLYLVERTVSEYLPVALENYLRLPAGYVSTQPSSYGSTPRRVLGDQLRLLEGEMRRIAAVIQRADMDRVLAHRRFLNDRFGRLDHSA